MVEYYPMLLIENTYKKVIVSSIKLLYFNGLIFASVALEKICFQQF